MIDGMMLGDGTLKQECRYPSFWVEQTDEEYAKHLWEKFKELNLVNSNYKKRVKIDKRLNKNGIPYKDSITYRFQSCSLPYFQKLMKRWYIFEGEKDHGGRYKKKTKIIPKDLKLTPIVLAYWVMDDGSYCKKSKTIIICSHGFTFEENNFLSNLLLENLGIESKVYKSKGRYYFLSINKIGSKLIAKMIKKHLIKSRFHKIGF